MAYTQAFPSNPIKVNGYYLDYTFNSDTYTVSFPGEPVIPGVSLDGFFFRYWKSSSRRGAKKRKT